MKNKIYKITGVFKNIPGKSSGETYTSKKAWYSRNFAKDFICTQETKCKTHEDAISWFPLSWHDNIYTSLNEDADTAHGGILTAINPKSNLKYIKHKEIEKGRALLITVSWKKLRINILNIYLHSGSTKTIVNARDSLLKKILLSILNVGTYIFLLQIKLASLKISN